MHNTRNIITNLTYLFYFLYFGVIELQGFHLGPGISNEVTKINPTQNRETLPSSKNNQNSTFTTVNLIKEAGYVAETHEVKTEDHYILTLHRIPHGRQATDGDNNEKKPIVILQHGILCTSAIWVLNGAENSLGFILADHGYDVWMTNSRGNTYSRRHEFLDPDKDAKKFFNFSFHEMGIYDMPASIDYVLKTTGQSELYYIGHSMGTTISYIISSMKPEYNKKIKAIFSFAPIAFLNNVKLPLRISTEFLEHALSLLKIYEVLPQSKLTIWADNHICNDNLLTNLFCQTVLQVVTGFDYKEIDKDIMHRIVAISPSGSSLKSIHHYVQFMSSGQLRMFDYGKEGNYLAYNQSTPPDYPVENITPPVLLFHGTLDYLSVEKDVQRLYNELPPTGRNKVIEVEFNHLDFLYAKDVKRLLYDQVVTDLLHYQPQ